MGAPVMRAWAVGVLLVLLAVLLPATAVSAHAELESSDPGDGATLAEPPPAVSFTFGEDLLERGNAVVVTEVTTGTRLETGAVEVDGDTVSVDWPSASPAGAYRAAFRVVSADGHPIEGTIHFTVQGSVGTPSTAASTPDAGSPGTSTATSAATVASDSAATIADDSASEDGDDSRSAWILGIGIVVLAAAAGAAWYLRRAG